MKKQLAFLTLVVSLAAIPASVSWGDSGDEVRDAVIAFNDAYLNNDLNGYFGFYADDATLLFDSGRVELATYRKEWRQLVESGGAVEKNTISDIKVRLTPAGDAAIATYLLEVQTRFPDGKVTMDHAHETDVWVRIENQWRVAHVHYTIRSPE